MALRILATGTDQAKHPCAALIPDESGKGTRPCKCHGWIGAERRHWCQEHAPREAMVAAFCRRLNSLVQRRFPDYRFSITFTKREA